MLSIRSAQANVLQQLKTLYFIDGGSPYPDPRDFFPSQSGTNFSLPYILQDFESLKSKMTIVEGINMNENGGSIIGNWHVSSMGRCLTAAKPFNTSKTTVDSNGKRTTTHEGEPGGISIDQKIAQDLKLKSLEIQVHTSLRNEMRGKPFASGSKSFVTPTVNPTRAWDQIFKNFQPPELKSDKATTERLKRLRAEQSVLDGMIGELRRFRRELVGIERVKLDAHENAIEVAERSLRADLEAVERNTKESNALSSCSDNWQKRINQSERISERDIPARAQAHADLIYAALACDQIQVAGYMLGYSSVQWNYDWLNLRLSDNIHNVVYHRAGSERENFKKGARWNWAILASLAKKMADTPDGNGTMLDNTLIYGTSHFGRHHTIKNIPVVLIGDAQGQLNTGRVIKTSNSHDKVLTTIGQVAGLKNLRGFGDYPDCGALPGLIKKLKS